MIMRDAKAALRGAANYTASEASQAYRGFLAAPAPLQDAVLSSVGYALPSRGFGIPLRRAVGGSRYWVRRSAYRRSYPPRWQTTPTRRRGTYQDRYRRYGATLAFNGDGQMTKMSLKDLKSIDRTTRRSQKAGLRTTSRVMSTRKLSRRPSRKNLHDPDVLISQTLRVHK